MAKKDNASSAPAKKKKQEEAKPFTEAPRLKVKYTDEVVPALREKFGYKNPMEIPKLDKIVVNCGCGEARDNAKVLEAVVGDLTKITGQKAIITKAKKSVANFKLREGMPIGCKTTLRGEKMYEFLERLIRIALPRIRDFKGVESRLDGRGNYTLGVTEQIIFPEINLDSVTKIMGMNITFVTSAKTDEEGFALLKEFGIPFKKKEN